MYNLQITCPGGDIGFVENKRGFCVEGNIVTDEVIDDNTKLFVELYDCNNKLVRRIYSDRKNKDIFVKYKGLTSYKEELDPNKEKLKEFGFAPLVVDDINNPYDSLYNGDIKAWFSNSSFKAIVVNGVLNDGLNLKDSNGDDYSLLDIGSYRLEVSLKLNDKILANVCKNIEIGKREYQLIGRFNPIEHKNRLIKWCNDNNVSIITDLIPGYLDAYLGKWYYHMGLLQMYRANDLCLFEDVNVKLFNYLIDSSSTSYETELAYLQANNKLNSRFEVYYYDIGESNIDDRQSEVLIFKDNEYGHICRVDILNNDGHENEYYLDRRNVSSSVYGNSITIDRNSIIAIMGIVKPIQLDPNDFMLNEDNTYTIKDYVDVIRYNINGNIIYRSANMKRFDSTENKAWPSVYEFYNIFKVDKDLEVHIDCIYKKGTINHIGDINIKVK